MRLTELEATCMGLEGTTTLVGDDVTGLVDNDVSGLVDGEDTGFVGDTVTCLEGLGATTLVGDDVTSLGGVEITALEGLTGVGTIIVMGFAEPSFTGFERITEASGFSGLAEFEAITTGCLTGAGWCLGAT